MADTTGAIAPAFAMLTHLFWKRLIHDRMPVDSCDDDVVRPRSPGDVPAVAASSVRITGVLRLPAPDVWHQTLENGQYANTQEVGYWWELFDDPILNHLIAYAGQQNLDLQAAVARIEQAVAQRCIVGERSAEISELEWIRINDSGLPATPWRSEGAGCLPGVTASGFAREFLVDRISISRGSRTFGGVSSGRSMPPTPTVGENVELYRDVLVTLYSEVARAYVDVRTTAGQNRLRPTQHRNPAAGTRPGQKAGRGRCLTGTRPASGCLQPGRDRIGTASL